MTDGAMLAKLKTVFGDGLTDDILLTYLDLAKAAVLRRLYPFDTSKTEVPDAYADTTIEIANVMLNKRGSEGEVAHSANGIDRTYETADIPASLFARIVPMCGVPL